MELDQVYRLYFRDVELFLRGLTGSESLAEELTQEAFFRSLRQLDQLPQEQDVRAWLFAVACISCRSRIKRCSACGCSGSCPLSGSEPCLATMRPGPG